MNDNKPNKKYVAQKLKQIDALKALKVELESTKDKMVTYLSEQLITELESLAKPLSEC